MVETAGSTPNHVSSCGQANTFLKILSLEFFFFAFLHLLLSRHDSTHTHFFKKGGEFIVNRCERISNQSDDVNSHLVILSDGCNIHVLYETK